MKKLTTLLLVTCLIGLPFSTMEAQQQPPPPGRFTMLELCIVVPVLALATVAVICIRYREAHTPWPTNSNQWSNSVPVQPPAGTNEYGIFTNSFASLRTVMLVDGPPVYTVDISGQSYCDTNLIARGWTNNVTFTNAFQFTIRAGESPDSLQPLYIVKGWLSAGGRLIQYEDPQGHYLCSSYAFWGSCPQSPPMGTGLERARFMTFTSP